MAALPLEQEAQQRQEQHENLGLIGKKCFQLEQAMRVFVQDHQVKLDSVLQRPALTLAAGSWSPVTASQFLRHLFTIDPRLQQAIVSLR
jgi:hypothetical protein